MLLSPGQSLGHYTILAMLGEGGMGEVYEARDENLGRVVALKVLTAESAQKQSRMDRFRTEARAVAALNHPNIVQIYSVEEVNGLTFLTMERVDGEPIDARIPDEGMEVGSFLKLATRLTAAIAAAHSAGITHRDLKPANILINAEGEPKILDFGLAKMEPRAETAGSDDEVTVMMTREGAVIGSAPYMSPEQARGEPIDARSDLFSLGTVLYQALTGISPFLRRSPVESQFAVIRNQPKALEDLRPDLPPAIAEVIAKAMAKDPGHRYQTARDLLADLEEVDREARLRSTETAGHRQTESIGSRGVPAKHSGQPSVWRRWRLPLAAAAVLLLGWLAWDRLAVHPSAAEHRSVAVLPFDNLTGSPASDYLGTGIAVHLITKLSELSDLRVIGRSEAWDEGAASRSRQELARRLGADMFLEGGVQRNDGELRVAVWLTDAGNNETLWGEDFGNPESQLMELQAEIARWVAGVLQVSLSRGEKRRLDRDPTRSFKAYDLYLQGQDFLIDRQLRRGPELADQVFRQAIREDPAFALAHVGLSEAKWRRFRDGEGRRFLDEAEQEANAAIQLDPELAAAQVARARILRERGEVGRSIAELQQAMANHPKPAEAYIELGHSFRQAGESTAAEEAFRAATVLDPSDWRNWNQLGVILTDQGRLAEAEEAYEEARTTGGPDNVWPLSNLVAVRVLQGKFDEAIETTTSSPAEITDGSIASNLGTAHFYLGRYKEAEPLYRRAVELEPDDPTYFGNLGDVLTALADDEEAMAAYLRAVPLAEARAEATGNPYDQLQSSLYNAKAKRCTRAVDRALGVTPLKAEDGYVMALIMALCGSESQAVTAVENAVQLGYPAELIAVDREFSHLRDHPDFQRIADQS